MNPTAPETDPTLLALQAAIRAAADRDDAAGMAAACLEHARTICKLIQSGKRAGEQTGFSEILPDVAPDNGEKRDHTLFSIAQSQRDSGLLLEAYETVLLLNDGDWSKAYLLSHIAQECEKEGQPVESRRIFLEAFNTALKITDPVYRCKQLAFVAAHAQIGEAIFEAINSAILITDKSYLPSVHEEIVGPFAGAGNTAAVYSASKMSKMGDQMLPRLINGLLKADRIDEAQNVADRIEHPKQHAESLAAIGLAESKLGREPNAEITLKKALDIAGRITNAHHHLQTLAYIATLQALVGRRESAKSAISLLKSVEDRDVVFYRMVTNYIYSKRLTDAENTAKHIKNPVLRSEVLIETALKQVELGWLESFDQVTTAALMAIKTIKGEDLHRRATLLADVAITFELAGQSSRAVEVCNEAFLVAQRVNEAMWRGGVLRKIVEAQAEIGQIHAAVQTSAMVVEKIWRVFALESAIRATIRSGRQTQAKPLAETAIDLIAGLDLPELRAESFSRIAQVLAEAGWINDAVAVCQSILTKRDTHLSQIAYTIAYQEKKASNKDNAIRYPGFKQLLVPCAYYSHSAYGTCSTLAKLYPEQAGAIGETVASSSP